MCYSWFLNRDEIPLPDVSWLGSQRHTHTYIYIYHFWSHISDTGGLCMMYLYIYINHMNKCNCACYRTMCMTTECQNAHIWSHLYVYVLNIFVFILQLDLFEGIYVQQNEGDSSIQKPTGSRPHLRIKSLPKFWKLPRVLGAWDDSEGDRFDLILILRSNSKTDLAKHAT